MIDQHRTFPFERLAGSHREIGRQFGEVFADLIRQHRDLALDRLCAKFGVDRTQALAAAARFRPYVVEHAQIFDDEIQGLAEGAGLSLNEAYLLQLRAELAATGAGTAAAAVGTPVASIQNASTLASAGLRASSGDATDECTTFAVLPEATSDGRPLVGGNSDLPSFYAEIGVVVEIVADDAPAVLMLTPAGQVSYVGINDRGLGVWANYLVCDGWRAGFPRYLLSRLALTRETVDEAIAAICSVPRASSRNLILLDAHGVAADLETTPTRARRLDTDGELLVHANHYIAPELLAEERAPDDFLANSHVRHRRMRELLLANRGRLNVSTLQTILRDRACHPNALCRMPGDRDADVITFASTIAEPTEGRLTVAVGPPNEHAYRQYTFSKPGGTPAAHGA